MDVHARVLRRFESPELKRRELIDAITPLKDAARECYADSIDLNDQEFTEVLVLDGCFIIEIFTLYPDFPEIGSDEPISSFKQYLYHDFVLLENQIPWVVLEHLFSLTMVSQQWPLIDLTLNFFRHTLSISLPQIYPDHLQGHNIKHILDLLRYSLVIPLKKVRPLFWVYRQPAFHCASGMKKAGIKIIRYRSNNILDIQFKKGVLQIPQLRFNDNTETIFRNLICLEQCYPDYEPIITSYAKFMNFLIDTNKDLQILCASDVIANWSNPEVLIQFFNKLSEDSSVNASFYDDILYEIIRYSKGWWPRLRFLYIDNFLSPWAIVSQVVAAILLILAFLQTLFSILSYKSSDG